MSCDRHDLSNDRIPAFQALLSTRDPVRFCQLISSLATRSGSPLWLYDYGLTSLNEKIGQLSDLKKLWLDKNPEMVLDDASWTALKRLDLHELYIYGRTGGGWGESAP